MNDINELLNEELKDEDFREAWDETELEYQIKRMLISERMAQGLPQKELSKRSEIMQSNKIEKA